MIFSTAVCEETRIKLGDLLNRAGSRKRREVESCLARIRETEDADVAVATAWILANSPLSDLANYDFSLFLNCARHGVFLRRHSCFAREVPEDLFLNYVLHIRVNEEQLCDCRSFFYEKLSDRLKGLSMHDAILEANYWNAEQVRYQSTDERTISALGAYRSGYGRCGEESAFAVNVFRSVGIPARQIYTPRWAHCDDNHAWVEVWCSGTWYFLGACEPEEVLNRGWFTNASSRAMVIHSRCFGSVSGEETISQSGMVTFLNHLPRYAVTKSLTVTVLDGAGVPVEGAEVAFQILNLSEFYDAAVRKTDRSGRAVLTCGLGSLNIRVRKDGIACEKLVFTPDTDEVQLILRQESVQWNAWQDFVFRAPRDSSVNEIRPTEEQKMRCLRRNAEAGAVRDARIRKMTETAEALSEKLACSPKIRELLLESRGNATRLAEFLRDEAFSAEETESLLLSLSKKDLRDVDPDVLREALTLSRPYADLPNELFYPYVVCPRVHREPLTRNRQILLENFSAEQKAAFRTDPRLIWADLLKRIGYDPSVEYGQIVTCPAGALAVGNADPLSRKILFVSICRALGIPARLDPVTESAQFWTKGHFCPVEPEASGRCSVIFRKQAQECWQYGTDFGISEVTAGRNRQLNLWNESWTENTLCITVAPGIYQILTDNRLPNGDLHASRYRIYLHNGETAEVPLHRFPADLSEMLDHYRLEEFRVFTEEGTPVSGSDLTRNKAILMWLDTGTEPTEHILNEMLEQQESFHSLPADLVFLLRGPTARQNEKLQMVLKTFPKIRVFYDSFALNVETLARRMYVDPDKLPLILITTASLDAIYACSGYQVGSGDLIVRICNSF